MGLKTCLATVALAAGFMASAAPAQTVLTFEGVADLASVDDFYNGGTDSAGNSGTDYGIGFSSNSLGLIDIDSGGSGNTANEPSGETTLFFLAGSAATMNVAAGFDTGFSFLYSANSVGRVTVYDGLNASGNVLASLALASQYNDNCAGDPSGVYCNFTAIGVNFAGIARSVDFGGAANFVVFDDITLGSATPGGNGVPEPATWAMMIGGIGAVGGALRTRRRRTQALA